MNGRGQREQEKQSSCRAEARPGTRSQDHDPSRRQMRHSLSLLGAPSWWVLSHRTVLYSSARSPGVKSRQASGGTRHSTRVWPWRSMMYTMVCLGILGAHLGPVAA